MITTLYAKPTAIVRIATATVRRATVRARSNPSWQVRHG